MDSYVLTCDGIDVFKGTQKDVIAWITNNLSEIECEASATFCTMIKYLREGQSCGFGRWYVVMEKGIQQLVGKTVAKVKDGIFGDMSIYFTDGTMLTLRSVGEDPCLETQVCDLTPIGAPETNTKDENKGKRKVISLANSLMDEMTKLNMRKDDEPVFIFYYPDSHEIAVESGAHRVLGEISIAMS